MIDLWELIVVDMFNAFWPAVLGLCGLMYFIFMMGKVSQITTLNFLAIFIIAMAIGYGSSLIAILTTIMLLLFQLLILPKMLNT